MTEQYSEFRLWQHNNQETIVNCIFIVTSFLNGLSVTIWHFHNKKRSYREILMYGFGIGLIASIITFILPSNLKTTFCGCLSIFSGIYTSYKAIALAIKP